MVTSVNFLTVWYTSLSCLTFAAYGIDKSAARKGERRTPEKTLLMLAFLCGWPGALVAQRTFRHKTKKASFLVRLWIAVALNLLALVSLVIFLV